MPIQTDTINQLIQLIGAPQAYHTIRLAKKIDRIEQQGCREMKQAFHRCEQKALDSLITTGLINEQDIYQEILDALVNQSFRVMKESIQSTAAPKSIRLAAPPKGKIPRSLKDLMKAYDSYRSRRIIPLRERVLANKIKDAYLKKVQSVWEKYSEDFRRGDETTKAEIKEKIKKAADTVEVRANMIVETETTRYYNKTRRQIYDSSPDVTHYLFVAIRDSRTTKWCKTRDGVIYAKTDPLLDAETPPIHPYCRSEIIPLTEAIPAQAKLIQMKSRQRRHRKCEPLIKGWKAS